MRLEWKSAFEHTLTVALVSGLVGGVVVYTLTYCFYYRPSLDLLEQQIAGIGDQIQATSAWENFNGLREAIHAKWYYMRSGDYDSKYYGLAADYDDEFEGISEHCKSIRGKLKAEEWKDSWDLVEEGYGDLSEFPGPLWVEKP